MKNSKGVDLHIGKWYRMYSTEGEALDQETYKLVELRDPKARLETDDGFKFWCPMADLYKSENDNYIRERELDRIQERIHRRDQSNVLPVVEYKPAGDGQEISMGGPAPSIVDLEGKVKLKPGAPEIPKTQNVEDMKLGQMLQRYANSNESRRASYGASGKDYKYTDADMLAFVTYCDKLRDY